MDISCYHITYEFLHNSPISSTIHKNGVSLFFLFLYVTHNNWQVSPTDRREDMGEEGRLFRS